MTKSSSDHRPHNIGLCKMLSERKTSNRAIRLIFLDVDGVLNNVKQRDAMSIDMNCIKIFAELVIKTGAYIVMSSTWRKHDKFMDYLIGKLRMLGIEDRLVGKTDIIGDFERPREVAAWIRAFEKMHFVIDGWVAIDDMNLEGNDNTGGSAMKGHCVLTSMQFGLTKLQSRAAENILMNRPERVNIGNGSGRRKSWGSFLFKELIGES